MRLFKASGPIFTKRTQLRYWARSTSHLAPLVRGEDGAAHRPPPYHFYQTNPCARRASSGFQVQGSTFSKIAKRTQGALTPHPLPSDGRGGALARRKLPNEPTLMHRRFKIPDLRW